MRRNVPRLVIAAPASGSGKTLVTCGILAAMKRRGAGRRPSSAARTTLIPCSMRRFWGRPPRIWTPSLPGRS